MRSFRRAAVVAAATVTATLLGVTPASAATLSATTLTWGVIGLDSNNVAAGPNQFPIGARTCASGGTVTNATARFTWDSSNPYINVTGPSVVSLGTIAGGTCRDAYFNVVITRTAAAYLTTRRFHITFSGTGATARSTGVREIYVEKLISQNRNDVLSIVGPSLLTYGSSYTIVVNADTAPNGYEQVEAFLSLPTSIFRIDSITLTATAGPSPVRQPYIDACTWDAVPTSPTYRSCLGTGKAGGTMTITYRVTVIGVGSGTASNAIYDFSGSSYHYNSDWGAPENTYTFRVVYPDLVVAKTHAGTPARGGTVSYALTVRNTGTGPTNQPITLVDTLPTGLTFVSASGGGFSCSASGQRVTCTRTSSLAAGASATVTLVARIAANAPATLTNVATVVTPNDRTPTNNSGTDILRLPVPVSSPTPGVTPGTTPTTTPTTPGGTPGVPGGPTGGAGVPTGPGAPTDPRAVPGGPGGQPNLPTGNLPLTGDETGMLLRLAWICANLGAALVVVAAARRRLALLATVPAYRRR